MKLKSPMTLNGKQYLAGERAPLLFVYPFFLFHMAMFGGSGFFMAYAWPEVGLPFLYLHGGIAITAYVAFYLAIFGVDEVKWMLINALLGILGIWAEINTVVGWFGKSLGDYSPWVHLIPFLYYVLYTFLLRQMLIDLTGSRDKPGRKRLVEMGYVLVSIAFYVTLILRAH